MLYKLVRNFKNLMFKNLFLTMVISKFYKAVNTLLLNNNIDIYRENKCWIHKTSLGLIPNSKPIFNPEEHVKKNFEIFFEHYLPKKNDIIVELGAGQGCETLYISKLISCPLILVIFRSKNNLSYLASAFPKKENIIDIV